MHAAPETVAADTSITAASKLQALAGLCNELGASGRSLRKLPVIAHARYLSGTSVLDWIDAIKTASHDL